MRLRFHKKRISNEISQRDKQIDSIKKYFLNEINKQRTFLNRKLTYAKKDISDEECWRKFAIGSLKNHRTQKISINRVRRLHWIFLLIDYIKKNNYISTDSDIEYSVIRKEHKIIVISEKYLIVLRLLSDFEIMVITAYPRDK